MQTVNIAKNLWINSAEVGFFNEGSLKGVYLLKLSFSGNPLGSADLMSEILEPLTSLKMPKNKIVLFTGMYNDDESDYILAVRAFQSWGFKVVVVIKDNHVQFSWINNVNRLILKTSSEYVPIVVHELWYDPKVEETVPVEPRLPHPETCALYFSRGYSMALTTQFIVNSKYSWSLL